MHHNTTPPSLCPLPPCPPSTPCSVRQLRMFLDEYAEIPLATLAYTCGECNYGGKVTDAHDRHTLMTVLEVYYNERVANQEKVALSPSGKYIIPAHTDYQVGGPEGRRVVVVMCQMGYRASWWRVVAGDAGQGTCTHDILAYAPLLHSLDVPLYTAINGSGCVLATSACLQGYVDYIQGLPLIAEPEVFGLHDNADMVKDLQESQALLEGLLTAQKGSETSSSGGGSRQSGGGAAAKAKSPEQMIGEVASDVLARLPGLFDIEAAELKYPQDYYNSMNTVLVQVGGRSMGCGAARLCQRLLRMNPAATSTCRDADGDDHHPAHMCHRVAGRWGLFEQHGPASIHLLCTNSTHTCPAFVSTLQELVRFNALLAVMHSSLVALGQAIQGLALMSSELDAVGKALFDGKVGMA